MINILKDVKDDNNVTKAKHNKANEKVSGTEVNTPQTCSNGSNKTWKRRMNKRRNEDWNKWKSCSQRRNEMKPTWKQTRRKEERDRFLTLDATIRLLTLIRGLFLS